jgi:hypothetical protein
MVTIRSFTSLEQSRKLAEILPIESADMFYKAGNDTQPTFGLLSYGHIMSNDDIPCWSLASLLSVLPAECECMSLEHINYGNNHKKYFMSYIGGENTDTYDNPVDACVAMIEHLHEQTLL